MITIPGRRFSIKLHFAFTTSQHKIIFVAKSRLEIYIYIFLIFADFSLDIVIKYVLMKKRECTLSLSFIHSTYLFLI